MSHETTLVLFLVMLLGGAILYITPALIAGIRCHHNSTAILMLNLFLGWTLLGWVVSLVWACTNPPPSDHRS